jgi:hypothetical protein
MNRAWLMREAADVAHQTMAANLSRRSGSLPGKATATCLRRLSTCAAVFGAGGKSSTRQNERTKSTSAPTSRCATRIPRRRRGHRDVDAQFTERMISRRSDTVISPRSSTAADDIAVTPDGPWPARSRGRGRAFFARSRPIQISEQNLQSDPGCKFGAVQSVVDGINADAFDILAPSARSSAIAPLTIRSALCGV